MQKETNVLREEVGQSAMVLRLQAVWQEIRDRLGLTEVGKYENLMMKRDFSREKWVNLALTDIERAVASGLLDKDRGAALAEAVRKKANAQQSESNFGR